jgi:pyrimidine-nucleoside phosphorylase
VVEAQHGDVRQVLEPERLPRAPLVEPLRSPCEGVVAAIDAQTVGVAAVRLGAGRATKLDLIRHDVGFVLHKKVGDRVALGEPLLDVHAGDRPTLEAAMREVAAAYAYSDEPVAPLPVLFDHA